MIKVLISVCFWVYCVCCLLFSACSHIKQPQPQLALQRLPIDINGKPKLSTPLWTRKMKGAISSLSLADQSQVLWVATSPDSDIEGSVSFYALTAYSHQGTPLWSRKMSSPIKDMDLAADGSWGVVSNYENELIALDSHGQVRWRVEATCKPHILNTHKKILCYHDDESQPLIAFDVLDWDGNKIFSYPIPSGQGDALSLKVSLDEQWVAIAFPRGQVVILDHEFNRVGSAQVEGEVVDLAIAPTGTPSRLTQLAILYGRPHQGKEFSQFLQILQVDGKSLKVFDRPIGLRALMIEWGSIEDLFWYGNGSEGQRFGRLTDPAWVAGNEWPTVYSSSVSAHGNQLIAGFIDASPRENRHLLFFDYSGQLQKTILLSADSEAHLFSYKAHFASSACFVATDDGRLSAYSFK